MLRCRHVLASLAARVAQLQQEWADHPTLLLVNMMPFPSLLSFEIQEHLTPCGFKFAVSSFCNCLPASFLYQLFFLSCFLFLSVCLFSNVYTLTLSLQLNQIMNRILSFSVLNPLVKYLTGLELLLQKAQVSWHRRCTTFYLECCNCCFKKHMSIG